MTRIPSITNSGLYKKATSAVSKGCQAVGEKLNKAFDNKNGKDVFTRVIKKFEPTGSNNSFFGMASLMVGTVVIPRVITASKRNPNDKEATNDEIAEILFRDVQTIAIMLFGLKALNAVVSSISGKVKGLPMTNKPFEKIFEAKGIKGKAQEFFQSPLKKLKKVGKNVVDTLNPLGGVSALSKEQFVQRYTQYESIEEVGKLFQDIANHGGEGKNAKGAKKVFDKMLDGIIEEAQEVARDTNTKVNLGISTSNPENITKRIEKLKQLKEAGLEGLSKLDKNDEIDTGVANLITDYLKREDNQIVKSALALNAGLKTTALGIEATYLGFGLPALNQKRLERKYLNKETNSNNNCPQQTAFNPLVDRNIKAQEVKIFHQFIK